MAVIEKSGLMKYKDKAGNLYLMLPITNADNVDGLDELIDEAKVLGTAVAATSTDGVAYVATVPGITALTAGFSFIMIPNTISTSRSTTLNVNSLGAKALRVRVSGYSGTTSSPLTTNWLAPNKPVRVTYDGMWWIAEVVLPSAQQLYGSVKAEEVTFVNTSSGLTATQVQAAIDELASGALRTQVLTTAEYNTVTDKDENTLYILSDDTSEEDVAAHIVNKSNPHGVTAEQVGAIPTTAKGTASGVASLGTDGKVPTEQLPAMNYDEKGAAAQALTDAKAYVDTAIQTAIQNTWEASY